MKTSIEGVNFIKRWEGFRAEEYACAAGKPTIGYGHMLKIGERMKKVTEAEAEELLCRDLEEAEEYINDLVDVPLTQGQFDALASFIFNLGGGAFKRSTLLRKLNAGNYEGAKEQFHRWCRVGNEVVAGLQKRRAAEAERFLPRKPEPNQGET